MRSTRPLASTKYWLSGPPEEPSGAYSSAWSASSTHSAEPSERCNSTCSTRAEVRSRSVKSTCEAIIRQERCPVPSAFLSSGTFRTLRSSGVSEATPFLRFVPAGKREVTTGRSQSVGPRSRLRTACVTVSMPVAGSLRLRR